MIDENSDPFWSRATRWATGVFPLKNFAQLASIAAVAPAPEVGSPPALEDGEGGGPELDEDWLAGGVLTGVLVELELLHPAMARPAVRSTAASRYCVG